MARKTTGLSRAQIDEFELLETQLARLHAELASMRKGKGADALNDFKLKVLNNLLARANVLLGARYEAVAGFDQFDADLLPSTSDALLVVSQYLGALEKLRGDNVVMQLGSWYWVIDGATSDLRTGIPKKLQNK